MTSSPGTDARATVVVGADGSTAANAALDWATKFAARHGYALRLVSAYPRTTAMGAGWTETPDALQASASDVLTSATERAYATDPSVPVQCVADCGAAHQVLTRHGKTADMIVLGRSRTNRLSALIARSAAELVPDHALAPTVVVPEHWDTHGQAHRSVVLALDATDESDQALAFALGLANELDVPLDVVGVARPLVAYSAALALITGDEDWEEIMKSDCTERLAPWRERYPGVDARLHVERGEPVPTLTEWSRHGQILVLGGRPHGSVSSEILGSLTPNVIAHSHCPVAVVHTKRQTRTQPRRAEATRAESQ